MEKQTKELRIQGNSDESVGISSDEIIIKSRFGNALKFDTKEDFNNFKSKLKEAFEYCIDSPSIETIEEIDESDPTGSDCDVCSGSGFDEHGGSCGNCDRWGNLDYDPGKNGPIIAIQS